MEINSSQGLTAYTNTSHTAPPLDKTQQNQDLETSRTAPNTAGTENSGSAQNAFEVTITPEAKRLAAQNTQAPSETQNPAPEDQADQTGQADQNTASGYEKSQIMNIIA